MTWFDKFKRRIVQTPPPAKTPATPANVAQPTATPARSTAGATTTNAPSIVVRDGFNGPRGTPIVALSSSTATPTAKPTPTPTPTDTTTSPTATPASTAGDPVQRAEEDAQRVDAAYQQGGAVAASRELDALTAANSDPAYTDALLAASAPTIDRISADLATRARDNHDDSGSNRTTEDSLTALANVADRAGPAGQAQLGQSLAAALPDQSDLNQFDDRLGALADTGKGSALLLAVSSALVAAGKTQAVGGLSGLVVDQVNGTQEAYAVAATNRDEAEARLAADIAAFGNSLTPEQLEAYKREYRELHKDVYAAEKAAADNLARTLEQARPVLEQQAIVGNDDAGKALYNGYNALARSPAHAAEAIRWATELATAPADQNPLFRAVDSAMGGKLAGKLENELLATAVANAQADILARSRPGSDAEAAQAAAAELTALLAPLGKVAALKGVPEQIGRFLEAVNAGQARDWDTVANNLLNDWDTKGNFGKALAIAGVAQSAYGAADAFQDGRYPDAIKNSAAFAKHTLEVSSALLNTFGKSASLATDVGKIAGRMAPGLGLVIDAIQFRNDVDGILKDPANAGKYVQILGTSISLIGDAAGIIPVAGTAVDVVLGLVGQGIHAIGGYISMAITGNREAKALEAERAQLVASATGLSPEASTELVNAGAAEINRLRLLGLSPEQIQQLATDPVVDLASMETAALLKTAAGFGLRGDDVLALLRAGQDNENLEYSLITMLNSPEATTGATNGDLSAYQQQLLTLLEADPETAHLAALLRRGSGTPDFAAWGQAYDTLEGDGYVVSA